MAWQTGPGKRHAPLTPAVLEQGSPTTASGRTRTYLHVDMDAFFAEVETRDNPGLRGKPVAVGGGPGKRGVVTSANYIARRFGLKAGMTSFEAQKRCPEVIFLPVNGSKYTYVSAQIMTALERFSPQVRPLSVDEASLDITDCERHFGSAQNLGRELKELISLKFRLPCTVGIGHNRLVAKMAANLGKPDGLLELNKDNAAATFAPLPVQKMVGIGDATRIALEQLGIVTLGDLAKCPDSHLKVRFGILGHNLKKMARGEWAGRMRMDDEREPEEKSIGHQRTFGENISDVSQLKARLVGLTEMVARRVRRAGVVGQVLTLQLRYTNFDTPHHQLKMPVPTDDEETLIEYAWRLLGELWVPGSEVRLLGLSLGNLSPKSEWTGQLDLFASKHNRRRDNLYEAIDALRDRFGEKTVARLMGGRFQEKKRRGSSEEIIPFANRVRLQQAHEAVK